MVALGEHRVAKDPRQVILDTRRKVAQRNLDAQVQARAAIAKAVSENQADAQQARLEAEMFQEEQEQKRQEAEAQARAAGGGGPAINVVPPPRGAVEAANNIGSAVISDPSSVSGGSAVQSAGQGGDSQTSGAPAAGGVPQFLTTTQVQEGQAIGPAQPGFLPIIPTRTRTTTTQPNVLTANKAAELRARALAGRTDQMSEAVAGVLQLGERGDLTPEQVNVRLQALRQSNPQLFQTALEQGFGKVHVNLAKANEARRNRSIPGFERAAQIIDDPNASPTAKRAASIFIEKQAAKQGFAVTTNPDGTVNIVQGDDVAGGINEVNKFKSKPAVVRAQARRSAANRAGQVITRMLQIVQERPNLVGASRGPAGFTTSLVGSLQDLGTIAPGLQQFANSGRDLITDGVKSGRIAPEDAGGLFNLFDPAGRGELDALESSLAYEIVASRGLDRITLSAVRAAKEEINLAGAQNDTEVAARLRTLLDELRVLQQNQENVLQGFGVSPDNLAQRSFTTPPDLQQNDPNAPRSFNLNSIPRVK